MHHSSDFFIAADYVRGAAVEAGLEDVRLVRQKWDGHGWSCRSGEAWLVAPPEVKLAAYGDVAMSIADHSRTTHVTAELDGFYADSTGATASWMAHVGRLVSTMQPTPVETAFQVEIPVVLHVAHDAHTVRVVMDVNSWFASPHVYDFNIFGAFNMDDPVALTYLHDNGSAHVFSLGATARAPN